MNKYELWNMAESETVPPKLEDPMHTKKIIIVWTLSNPIASILSWLPELMAAG